MASGGVPQVPEATHTILLVQTDADKYSRTYYDFNSLADALGGISLIFENTLRELNRHNVDGFVLKYEVADILRFLDSLPDLSVLILEPRTRQYLPFGKTFLKNRLFEHLQRPQKGL